MYLFCSWIPGNFIDPSVVCFKFNVSKITGWLSKDGESGGLLLGSDRMHGMIQVLGSL